MTALTELAFPAMGTSVRLLAAPGAPLDDARALIEDLEARLTRFDSASELSVLNADPRETVPASRTLRDAVRSALAGAAATDGLVDPTLLGAVVRAGYDRTLVGHPRANLRAVLAAAPEPRPATPPPAVVWRRIHIDDAAGTITRPPGVKLDLGGSAKGLAADLAAELLAPYGPCAADLGGDLRVHGVHEVLVPNPVHRHAGRGDRVARRRGRHLGDRQAAVVGRDRPPRPPPARSRDRPARLDRRPLRHREGPDRCARGSARQGGRARRPGRGPPGPVPLRRPADHLRRRRACSAEAAESAEVAA